MMRNTIVRTMATSTIHAYTLTVVNGKPEAKELAPVTIMGKASEKDALKALRKEYGKDTPFTVGEIKVEEATYEIGVEDFVKHAKRVDKADANETEN